MRWPPTRTTPRRSEHLFAFSVRQDVRIPDCPAGRHSRLEPPGRVMPCGSTYRRDKCDLSCSRRAKAIEDACVATVTRREADRIARILVANDVEETRDGIEKLLTADGYRIDLARSEEDAVDRVRRHRPDLILVSLPGSPGELIATAARIRQRGGLSSDVPVVVFCVPTIDEGAEVAIGNNVYVTRPDNFDQLKAFLARLLRGSTSSA
jgi:CheY-like chemotaxis protein